VPCSAETGKLISLEQADADGDGEYSEAELSALTKAQIAELAAQLGIEGISTSQTKSQMIEAFLAAQE
jgi:hypothetical protein